MLALQTSGELNQHESEALESLLQLHSIVCKVVEYLEIFEWSQPSQANLSVVSHGTAGCPKV